VQLPPARQLQTALMAAPAPRGQIQLATLESYPVPALPQQGQASDLQFPLAFVHLQLQGLDHDKRVFQPRQLQLQIERLRILAIGRPGQQNAAGQPQPDAMGQAFQAGNTPVER